MYTSTCVLHCAKKPVLTFFVGSFVVLVSKETGASIVSGVNLEKSFNSSGALKSVVHHAKKRLLTFFVGPFVILLVGKKNGASIVNGVNSKKRLQ